MAGPIHIARDELNLGALPESDVRALLAAGLLKPDDHFWTKGMADWRPLSELDVVTQKASLLKRAKITAAAATEVVAVSALKLAEQARTLAGKGSAGISQARYNVLEGYLPQIKQLIVEKISDPVLKAARGAIENDGLMAKVFGVTYDCLPKPVRRFVSEKDFIAFCLEHRRKLLF